MLFTREDWKLFRNIETLCQKAGVGREDLPGLVIKELVDNALDVSGNCELGITDDGIVSVANPGEGIDPTVRYELFCINRPLVSTKLLRLPTRGTYVMKDKLNSEVEGLLQERLKEEILQEAGFEQRLMEELKDLRPVLEEKGESLNTLVHKELERHKEYHWTKPVQQVAKDLVNKRIS